MLFVDDETTIFRSLFASKISYIFLAPYIVNVIIFEMNRLNKVQMLNIVNLYSF
jgi:hypothetical protein